MGSNAVAAPPSQCSSSSLPASPSATATMRAWSTSMTDRNYQVERLSGEGDRIRSEREDWVTGSPHCRRATTGAAAGTETSHERICDDLGRRRAGPDRHIGAIESRRSVRSPAMGTPWDAQAYDRPDAPQRAWAADVLARLADLAPDATVLDVGCETGRVTEALLELMPRGRVLALGASPEMVTLARRRLGGRAQVWCQDVLDLDLAEPVDAVVSTAALHWSATTTAFGRGWPRALRPGGRLEAQCGGQDNLARVLQVIDAVARDLAPELVGWSPWVFAGSDETERRLRDVGFTAVRCWLEERPTCPPDLDAFARTSILPAHLARLSEPRRERFAAAVVANVSLPLDFIRLNVSAIRC